MKEDKKYVWWGLLGIGVAAFFYFLSSKKSGQSVQVPYLVPSQMTTGASPSADTSLSSQANIIGNSPGSPAPNGSAFGNFPTTNPVGHVGNNVMIGQYPSTGPVANGKPQDNFMPPIIIHTPATPVQPGYVSAWV
jgi:hypothetical protein